VAPIAAVQCKRAGEVLFREGDPADSVYEVLTGMVRLYKLLPDGRRQITGFLSRGNLLGLAPEGICVFTAEALTDVTLSCYRRKNFERLIDELPGFARRLLAVASSELNAAQDQMLLLGRKTAAEKVASFLLVMADRHQGDRGPVEVPMTRADMADYLGLTIETVSRTITRMRQDGLISIPSAAHIEITDRNRLQILAAGEADCGL
jgi:CRP/FNR family transcriptional regulator